jgi:hypothetical protein
MRLVYFSSFISSTFTFQGDVCCGGIRSEQQVTALLKRNADGTDKEPPLVIGK